MLKLQMAVYQFLLYRLIVAPTLVCPLLLLVLLLSQNKCKHHCFVFTLLSRMKYIHLDISEYIYLYCNIVNGLNPGASVVRIV